MLKHVSVLFSTLFLLVTLSGCGEKKEPPQETPISPPPISAEDKAKTVLPPGHPPIDGYTVEEETENKQPTSQPASQPAIDSSTAASSQPASQPVSQPAASQPAIEASTSTSADAGTITGTDAAIAGLQFMIPAGWMEQTPSSKMRIAQYSLPGLAGAAELTFFSSMSLGGGGSVEQNAQRWIGQFSNTDDASQPPVSEINKQSINGLTITVVKASGTYAATSMGPMAASKPPIANQALYGLIVQGGKEGDVMIKATGPKATIDAHSAALEAFTKSMKAGS